MFTYDSLLFDIIISIIRTLHDRPRLRKKVLIINSVVDLIAFVLFLLTKNRVFDIYWGNSNTPQTNEFVVDILFIVFILASLCLLLVLCSFLNITQELHSTSQELIEISKRKQSFEKKIDEQKDDIRVQDIIQLNLSQLNEYYTINKSQTKRAYTFSIFMILAGFVLIFVAIVSIFFSSSSISITVIISIAGLISEFIGATSLTLYKESSKHVNEFLNRLTYLQKVMLAIELVDRIASEDKKEEQLSNIIINLMKTER